MGGSEHSHLGYAIKRGAVKRLNSFRSGRYLEDHDAITDGEYPYNYSVGTILEPGFHDLTVTFIPKDEVNYSSVSRKVSVQVNKVPLQLEWTPPKDIPYLTMISSEQLNASVFPGRYPW